MSGVADSLAVRWTIGDVAAAGFEALRLSVHGAHRLFGDDARYLVCVNRISPAEARRRTGTLPVDIEWIATTRADIPPYLHAWLDPRMAEGVAWKLAHPDLCRDVPSLALDNDCILWALPEALARWRAGEIPAVVAEDVAPCFGVFAPFCPPAGRNSGIRALAPDIDYQALLRTFVERRARRLTSELDEQGLQVAALTQLGAGIVSVDEVSICSPFPPHVPWLGRCGAHFVGLNARTLPWRWYDRPAAEVRREHWYRLRAEVYTRVGLDPPRDHAR